jgi:hypothetical protein
MPILAATADTVPVTREQCMPLHHCPSRHGPAIKQAIADHLVAAVTRMEDFAPEAVPMAMDEVPAVRWPKQDPRAVLCELFSTQDPLSYPDTAVGAIQGARSHGIYASRQNRP